MDSMLSAFDQSTPGQDFFRGLKDAPEENSLSRAELHRILGDHQRYRTRQRGKRAQLQSAKLDGVMMAKRDLSEADLSGASLVGANLCGANLSGASLYCADLRGCDLRYARLDHADLRGASFKGANLSYAMMDFADLRAATMLRMGDKLKFQGNAHDESPFGAVDFTAASLRHASFRNAKLDHANFTDALLEGASFRGARMRIACFRNAVLSGFHLEELSVPASNLRASLPPPSSTAQHRAKSLLAELVAHHEWFTSLGQKGRPATIDGEDLRPLSDALKGLCLAGLSAHKVIAVSVDFTGCKLQAARFDGADVRAARFVDCDLSGASFLQAKRSHASFRNARIQDLTLYTGNVLVFRADAPEGVPGPFGDAQIGATAFMAGLSEQSGTC